MRNINLLVLGIALGGSLWVCPASAQSEPKPAPGKEEPAAQTAAPAETTPAPAQAPPVSPAPSSSRTKNSGPIKPKADANSAFIIGPEDVLAVRVWDEPGLSGPVTVGPDGMISLQLIHEVKAAGLTTVQLEAALTEQFKQFRNNPDVSVAVMSVRSRKYLIQGGVNRPGTYPLTGPTPVLEALVNGAGFKEFSNPKKIYILRTKPDGTTEKLKFNYKEASQGKNMQQNIFIQNGDQIFVPE